MREHAGQVVLLAAFELRVLTLYTILTPRASQEHVFIFRCLVVIRPLTSSILVEVPMLLTGLFRRDGGVIALPVLELHHVGASSEGMLVLGVVLQIVRGVL